MDVPCVHAWLLSSYPQTHQGAGPHRCVVDLPPHRSRMVTRRASSFAWHDYCCIWHRTVGHPMLPSTTLEWKA
jgi:hypothetical protein